MNLEDILQSYDSAERLSFNSRGIEPGKPFFRQPEDIWSANPLVSERSFTLNGDSLTSHFKNI